ncbi:MAG: adenylyltransferase/cytidyltransferase family protein [Candidatus Acidiferrales bacterium]
MGQVVSQRELLLRRGEWKRTGEGVVCAYGSFDLLHPGHIRLLEQARDFGEILAVAVQSDDMLRRREGCAVSDCTPTRPVTPAAERAEIVAALDAVDVAAVADGTLSEFLTKFRPDAFVRGDERSSETVDSERNLSADLESMLTEIGCKLVRLPLEPGFSSTGLIERISGHRA